MVAEYWSNLGLQKPIVNKIEQQEIEAVVFSMETSPNTFGESASDWSGLGSWLWYSANQITLATR